MDKYSIIRKIENFAPLHTAEKWDCAGWLVETSKKDINNIMLALTVTQDIVTQARENHCDMIISHHPLFSVPIDYKGIDIYCAHTNMDLADGGTTDSLVKKISLLGLDIKNYIKDERFVRYAQTNVKTEDFKNILSKISPSFRYTTNNYKSTLTKIAFCAGSGSEFIEQSFEAGADAYVTGDLKFHTALESPIMVFDIGHFESEIQVLEVFRNIIGEDVKYITAKEESPFNTFSVI